VIISGIVNEIELTRELIRINSENPPGNEREIAKFIKDFLEDLKISTELIEFEPNRFNAVASIGSGKGLMLNGHMDTVPAGGNWKYNPFEGKIVNGKIYGRGASDMKGGLAAILIAVKNLSKEKFKKKLLLTFVADEEVALKGSEHLIKNRKEIFKNIKYGIMGECTDLRVRIAQKGIVQIKVKFKGKAAHGSKPELGDNAIYKATDFIQELKRLIEQLKKRRNIILGSGTINVGTINGGTKINVVPDFCNVEIDRRIIPGETPDYAIKQIRKILKKLKLKADIELGKSRLPLQLSKSLELIKILKSITKTNLVGESGYTEAELFYRDAGVPCVSFGPGISELAHTANEYILIKNLKKATKIYEKIIRKVCL
jgi:acetylornithine deacetylase/succinyl-diaminopimelate desuccinylase family protein